MAALFCAVAFVGQLDAASKRGGTVDPQLPEQVRSKMEEWEGRQLRKAEDLFFGRGKAAKNKKRYNLAATSFKGFTTEFPRSQAYIYAVYMEGRSHHMDNKRNKARLCYDDILDVFSNDVSFACAAAFYKGQSYIEDSDEELAMKAWAVIAKDPQYRKQPIAGKAIVELAHWTWKKGKYKQATEYFWDVAKTFRQSNRDAANKAIGMVKTYHIRIDPKVEKLEEFYRLLHGFGNWRKTIPENLLEDEDFWRQLLSQIRREGQHAFSKEQEAQKKQFYAYWAGKMEGKRAKDDDFQKNKADFFLISEGQREKWYQRLDEQFEKYQRAGDNGRIIKWMGWYSADKDKIKEYYAKLKFEQMNFDQKFTVLGMMFGKVGLEMGMVVANKFNLEKMTDAQRIKLAEFMYANDKPFGLKVVASIENDEEANWTLLNLMAKDEEATIEDKAAIAAKLSKSQKYNGEAQWLMGGLYEKEKMYQQAIGAYFASNKAPDMGYAAARCHMSNGDLGKAISELQGIENLFKKDAPNAAMVQAKYYDKAKKAEQRNATLHRILKAYKGTSQASAAHVWAERLRLPFVGTQEVE